MNIFVFDYLCLPRLNCDYTSHYIAIFNYIIERTDEKITDDSIKDLMISYKTRKHDKTVFK